MNTQTTVLFKTILLASLCLFQLSNAATITITSPTNGSTVSCEPLVITGTSSQAYTTVQLRINTTVIGATTTNAQGDWSFSLQELASGTYALTATLLDSGFEILGTSTNTFTMANPELITITNPTTGENIFANPAIISGTSSIPNGLVHIYLNDNLISTATAHSNSWSTTYTVSSFGPHTLLAQLMVAGNAVATTSVNNLSFFSTPAVGRVLRVDSLFGNDATGKKNILPFATISEALTAATSGDVVWIFPGTYNESFTIPTGVTVRGFSKSAVTIQKTATDATDLITMGENSCLQDVTLALLANSHVQLRGIVLPGTTTATATIKNIDLTVDNSGAGAGSSNVYGIHSTGTGNPSFKNATIASSTITVNSVNNGDKRGILVDSASSCNIRETAIAVNNSGAGTGIAVETNHASANFSARSSSLSGSTADISQTLGTLLLSKTELINSTVNGFGFSTLDQLSSIIWSTAASLSLLGISFMQIGTALPGSEQFIYVSQPLIVKSMAVQAVTGPGGSRTDTWTLRKNGVDQALTVSLTGAATSNINNAAPISFAPGDTISLKINAATLSTTVLPTVTMNLFY